MSSHELQAAMAQAARALERGHGAEAIRCLKPLASRPLPRRDELALRCAQAEAWLQQDDVDKASATLGRTPDTLRETVEPAILSGLWRLHGRVAFERGDQPRAIALLGRALKQAERAHDSRAIGLALYELGKCYGHIGDTAIVRDYMSRAASALQASGDHRYLALVHSSLGVSLGQNGRYDEALAAFRQAEVLAARVQAEDVLAIVHGNQAVVALMKHRYEQALALAERSVRFHEHSQTPHGLAVALATLGQICVDVGDLERAERVLHRAFEARTPVKFHETTGAVFDSLAQVQLVRGRYDDAAESLRRAAEAYGGFGQRAGRWYEWSVRVSGARLAMRRGALDEALKLAQEIVDAPGVPPGDRLEADLIANETLLLAGRHEQAEGRLAAIADRLDPHMEPGAWGEYLRIRGQVHEAAGRLTEAYHDLAQSASLLELLGRRYQTALTHLALGRLLAQTGQRPRARAHLSAAIGVFHSLGAAPDLAQAQAAVLQLETSPASEAAGTPADADDAIVRRLVDAAALPELLGRETAAAALQACEADAAAVFVRPPGAPVRVIATAGCEDDPPRAVAQAIHGAGPRPGHRSVEPLGHDADGPRFLSIARTRAPTETVARRLRTVAAVARQGFELCRARARSAAPPEPAAQQPLEPLLPGFICASAAMTRLVTHIQRLQGNDLTVLITGESGTGKELVARAIHAGSPRGPAMFLPFNCTTTTRELADSQLFGHRRGSFTGAVADQPGLVRAAAGGTLFLDEIGDLPLEIQPKLLRFLEQSEIMPVGETRPQRIDVRVVAATNADLEQRVAEGKFREDLYYRLNVIRVHVPPLRERREEIPHLSMFFLRETQERLGKADIRLGSRALDLFADYRWPGNVRQLRNEIQRAVALCATGETVGPEHLSPELNTLDSAGDLEIGDALGPAPRPASLAAAVERIERELIRSTLDRSGGNISETARLLGLTRRGLYLKLRRLRLEARMPATR